MPLDPSIPLGVKPVQLPNPLEIMSTVAQLQGQREQTEARRLAADAARQKANDEAAVRRVLTETGGDIEKALPQLRQIVPKAALDFEKTLAEQRKTNFEALRAETEFKGKQLDHMVNLWQSVNDQTSLDAVRPMIVAASPDLAPLLPTTWDPARHQQILNMGLTVKEAADLQREGLKLFTEGKVTEGLGTLFSAAKTPEQWDTVVDGAEHFGVPKEVIAQFGGRGAFSPENVTRAGQLAITPAKQAELAGQAATREQTAARDAATQAHQAVIEHQGTERIALARQRLAKGTGTDRDRSDLMQAVIDNPGLWDQITPTERGKIAGDLNARGFTGFGKPLSDAAIKQISDSEAAIASLTDLRQVLKDNEQYIGPIAGLAAINPYSEANKARADIDRVRQRVGKTLEGGVLRKEDEEKYKKILATLTDVPSTAIYKVDQLEKDIKRDIELYKHNQRLAGRRVPASETAATDTTKTGGGLTYQDYLNSRKK